MEYNDGLQWNILSSELYRDQTDSLSSNKNRNLDYFGFENVQGAQENIAGESNPNLVPP